MKKLVFLIFPILVNASYVELVCKKKELSDDCSMPYTEVYTLNKDDLSKNGVFPIQRQNINGSCGKTGVKFDAFVKTSAKELIMSTYADMRYPLIVDRSSLEGRKSYSDGWKYFECSVVELKVENKI